MSTSKTHPDDREAAVHTILRNIDDALLSVIEHTKTARFDPCTAVTLLTHFGAVYRSEGCRVPLTLSEMLPTTPDGPGEAPGLAP